MRGSSEWIEPLRFHCDSGSSVDTDEVQFAVALALCELGARKPTLGEFATRVRHIFSAEDAEAQHFSCGVKSGVKPGSKSRPGRAVCS